MNFTTILRLVLGFFFKIFVCLLEREKAQTGGGTEGEGGGDSLLSGEPDMGLLPRTLGS